MNTETIGPAKAFISASEVWKVEGGSLVHAGGNYGALEDFEAASARESYLFSDRSVPGGGSRTRASAEGLPRAALGLRRLRSASTGANGRCRGEPPREGGHG